MYRIQTAKKLSKFNFLLFFLFIIVVSFQKKGSRNMDK